MNHSHTPNRREFITAIAGSSCLIAHQARAFRIGGGFRVAGDQVRGMAVSPTTGEIAIAVDRQVDLYDGSGRRRDRRELESPVRAVAFGSDGRLYAAMKDVVAKSDGCCFETLPSNLGRAAVLTSLAVDDGGRVYAADAGNKVVWKLGAKGEVIARIAPGKQGFTVAKAFFPIAWRAGQLLVGEPGRHRVLAFGDGGELVGEWGAHSRLHGGFGGCCNPVGLAAAKDGFITAERGLVRVKHFEATGGSVSLLAGPDEFSARVQEAGEESSTCEHGGVDVAVLSGGGVLVLDRAARRITVIA